MQHLQLITGQVKVVYDIFLTIDGYLPNWKYFRLNLGINLGLDESTKDLPKKWISVEGSAIRIESKVSSL